MSHDQLFKDLLHAFFREFLELFFPQVASRLDFSRVTFLDTEQFTDIPEGELRRADVAAQVYTIEGTPEIIIVHVEVESQRRPAEFPGRMFEYYMLFRLRYRLPVFPVVVYLSPGAGGLTQEQHREELFGVPVCTFEYSVIGLPDMEADAFQSIVDNPLAPALSALMRAGQLGRVARKLGILRQTLTSAVDEARKSLLLNLIETYLPLNEREKVEFEQQAAQTALEVREMLTIYEERGIEKGIVQGLQRRVLKELTRKFGTLPAETVAYVRATQTEAEVDALLDRVEVAASLEELGLS